MDDTNPTEAAGGGEIAVGTTVLVFGALHGADVAELPAPVDISLRTPPVVQRPDPVRLLDREVEFAEIQSSVAPGVVVHVVGEAGMGKTALLRHLAHSPSTDQSPDGVVYVSCRGLAASDVTQAIYDAVAIPQTRAKATNGEIADALSAFRLLVVLDELELASSEAEELVALLQNSATVAASRPGISIPGAKVVPLGGLPAEAAIALLAQLIGHEPSGDDAEAASAIAAAVGGNPQRLVQAGALAGWSWAQLGELAGQLGSAAGTTLAGMALAGLNEIEQRLVAALALPDNPSIAAGHVDALSSVDGAGDALRRLVQAGLVVDEDERVRLADEVFAEVEASWPLSSPRSVALAYITGWAEGKRRSPDAVADESHAIVGLAEWATASAQHRETLRLAWVAVAPLALGRRFGAWGRLLNAAHGAARALDDRAAEAWVEHEHGTRALLLGDSEAAMHHLETAAEMREVMGDGEGAAATRRTIGLVPSGKSRRKTRAGARSTGEGGGFDLSNPANRRLLLLGGAVAAAAIAVGVVLATRGGEPDTTSVATPAEPTPGDPLVPPPPDPVDVPPTQPDPPAPPPVGTGDLQSINPNGPPIQEGSQSERVRRLQVALQVFGYEPGTPDGAYGPATRDAITEFQKDNNLDADGVAGRATLRAINQRIRNTA